MCSRESELSAPERSSSSKPGGERRTEGEARDCPFSSGSSSLALRSCSSSDPGATVVGPRACFAKERERDDSQARQPRLVTSEVDAQDQADARSARAKR